LRNGKPLPADLHCQPGDNAEGERDLQREQGAVARLARHLDTAADLFQVLAHHIQPDPASGDIADHLGGGKAGFENQVEDLVTAHRAAFGGGDQSGGDRLGDDAVFIQPVPVIADHDGDGVARLPRRDGEQTNLALAIGEASGRRFDPVVDRIADDVGQRVADRLDHLAVEFNVAAVEIDHHLLAEFR